MTESTTLDLGELRRSSDRELIREYTTPSGETLYAYRDGDEHVVVSRGKEPADQWDKRIPATVKRPVPGQHRWTIPNNWEQRVISRRDKIAYGLYYVPESDVWAKVSIPTNDWLVNAWYGVRAVGNLAVKPDGELGTSTDVRDLAAKIESEGTERAAENAELVREVAHNWDHVEKDLEMCLEWVRDEGFDQLRAPDHPVHADGDWAIEFHRERIFTPTDAMTRGVNTDAYETPLSIIVDELRDAGLLPDHYRFRVGIDSDEIGVEYLTRGLIEAGASAAQALDYTMVEHAGFSQSAWADERGVGQSTVSGNVSGAREALQ